MGISRAYAEVSSQEKLVHDPAQLSIVEILQQLQDSLHECNTPMRRILGRLPGVRSPVVKGVYLWGEVGRGKTFLMDLFFATLAIPRKKRTHFHRMMGEIHSQLKTLGQVTDPVDRVAANISRGASVLCFDEFYVNDIGDAMILGRLLDGLVTRGVTLIATSNVPPANLYSGGLQRERFLPAIALLEAHTQVVRLDDGLDYRLRLLQKAGTYLTPDDAAAEARLEGFFDDCAAAAAREDPVLEILGRRIASRRCATHVVWFDFAELCGGPRSPQDYIEIARRFQTVIVSGIPVLTADDDDAARRFISLVDEFYDRRVKLMVTAAGPIGRLYRGERLAFEFRRTVSRLTEMQSTDYLHTAHRG